MPKTLIMEQWLQTTSNNSAPKQTLPVPSLPASHSPHLSTCRTTGCCCPSVCKSAPDVDVASVHNSSKSSGCTSNPHPSWLCQHLPHQPCAAPTYPLCSATDCCCHSAWKSVPGGDYTSAGIIHEQRLNFISSNSQFKWRLLLQLLPDSHKVPHHEMSLAEKYHA